MLWKTTSKTHSSCEETWYIHVNTLRFAQKHFCDNHTSLLQPHQDNCIVTVYCEISVYNYDFEVRKWIIKY